MLVSEYSHLSSRSTIQPYKVCTLRRLSGTKCGGAAIKCAFESTFWWSLEAVALNVLKHSHGLCIDIKNASNISRNQNGWHWQRILSLSSWEKEWWIHVREDLTTVPSMAEYDPAGQEPHTEPVVAPAAQQNSKGRRRQKISYIKSTLSSCAAWSTRSKNFGRVPCKAMHCAET